MRRNHLPTESPDCRDGVIDGRGNWYTRPGLVRQPGVALGSAIQRAVYLKSDDCVNDYIFAVTDDGKIIEDPGNYDPLPPRQANLIAWWKLEEAEGTIYDETDNDNDGIYNGALYQQAGQVDYALGFDGVNDYVTVPDADNLKPGNITLMGWVKFRAIPYAGDCWMIGKRLTPSAGYSDIAYAIVRRGAGANKAKITIEAFSTSAQSTTIFSASNTNQWFHFCGTYDGTYLKIYINGQLKGTVTHVGTLSSSTGSLILVSPSNQTALDLDEVAIWDRALTADEIATYYEWNK